jgi:hypothetical protein
MMMGINTISERRPSSFEEPSMRSSPHIALSTLILALAGCGGSDATDTFPEDGRYALSTTLFQPDGGATSLLGLIDDPGVAGEFDTTRAIEIGGAAALFGDDGRNVFALGSSDSATVTRYERLAGGALAARGALSLGPYGITSAFKRPELVPMLSATKAYWIDDVSSQVVVWDPAGMTVNGSFSLEAAQRDGLLLEVGEAMLRDGALFVSANYRTADDGEVGEAVAIVIDTVSDTVTDVLTDERCGGTLDIAAADDGTLYFASNSYAASLFALGRSTDYPAPCVLRINPGERVFDPGYVVSMLELTEGRAAGQLVLGGGGSAYVLALHTELLEAPFDPNGDLFAAYEASAWRWWSVELGSANPGVLVADAPVRSAANRVLSAGGREFIANLDLDTGTTTLLSPQPGGQLAPGLAVTGYPYGMVQLR